MNRKYFDCCSGFCLAGRQALDQVGQELNGERLCKRCYAIGFRLREGVEVYMSPQERLPVWPGPVMVDPDATEIRVGPAPGQPLIVTVQRQPEKSGDSPATDPHDLTNLRIHVPPDDSPYVFTLGEIEFEAKTLRKGALGLEERLGNLRDLPDSPERERLLSYVGEAHL